jgi:AcrR family transcriptional regulator
LIEPLAWTKCSHRILDDKVHSVNTGAMKEPYHHGDLRNGLITEGLRLVESSGADGFSLREAARGLGVTANAAYRHFADKSDLLTAIAAHGFGTLADRLQASLDASGQDQAPARIRILGMTYVEFAIERPELFRLMFGPHGLCKIRALPQTNHGAFAGQILSGILDDMVSQGHMSTTARDGALLRVCSTIHGFALLALDGLEGLGTPARRGRAQQGLMEFILRGLCDQKPA